MAEISSITNVNELFKAVNSDRFEGGIINGSRRSYWRIANEHLRVYRRYNNESILHPIGSFSEPTNVSIISKDSFSSYVIKFHFAIGADIGYENPNDLLKQRGIAVILEYDKETNTSETILFSDCYYGPEDSPKYGVQYGNAPANTFQYITPITSYGQDPVIPIVGENYIFDHNTNKFYAAAGAGPNTFFPVRLQSNKLGSVPNTTSEDTNFTWTDSDRVKGWNRIANRDVIIYIRKSIISPDYGPLYEIYGTFDNTSFTFVSRDKVYNGGVNHFTPFPKYENGYAEYIDLPGASYPYVSALYDTLSPIGAIRLSDEYINPNLSCRDASISSENAYPFGQYNLNSARFPNKRKTYSRPIGFILVNYTSDENDSKLSSESILPGFFSIDGHRTPSKININPTVTMNDWVYGQTPSTPVLTGNTGNGTVTYKYKSSEQEDSAYTTTQPTNPGSYVIKAEIAETETYNSGSATDTFSILKISFNPSVSMESYYDTATVLPNPVLTGNTSNGTVTYSYKRSGSPDTEYTSTKPTVLGDYIVRAVIAETATYEGKTVTSTFSVLHKVKQKIEPTVSLRNFHIDELAGLLNNGNVPIPTVTNNLGNAPVKFMYKRKSKPSTEYTNVFPNDIGAYDIKAYIHESDEYFDAECFGTFSVYNPNVDERDGTTVVSVYSNVKAGNVTDIDTKLYAEYKKNSDTIKDKMSLFTIDSDNRYKILLQGAVNNANEVTIESSISAKIDFIIEKCVIMGDRIICYTDSKQPSYHVANDMLPGTAFTQMAINTQEENDFIIENMPDGHYGYLDVPMYEQYPIMSGSEITSYDYRRIGTNKVLIDNGYAFDRLNSAYYALPEDIPVFSSDEVVITKNGWNISPSGVCRQILTLPLKHIKDYFPNSRIYYETQTTI